MLETRELGRSGLKVAAIGLGCMGMSEFYGPGDDRESATVIRRAVELGVTLLDTADMYGPYKNEELVGRVLRGIGGEVRSQIVLATKFGITRSGTDSSVRGINGRPEYVRAACDASLKRLGVDYIDLYYQHRMDPTVPVEDTVGAMADLVRQGKVRYLGMSEAGVDTVRRAFRVHAIAALQYEYSLWTRDPEMDILPLCRELGIGLVAYSPLGRGFLTGKLQSINDLAADDFRRHNPRFQGENFKRNLGLVAQIRTLAAEKNCTPSQLALAWVLSRGKDIVPIPGTKRIAYLEQNLLAAQVVISQEDTNLIDAVMPRGIAVGDRYPAAAMAALGR